MVFFCQLLVVRRVRDVAVRMCGEQSQVDDQGTKDEQAVEADENEDGNLESRGKQRKKKKITRSNFFLRQIWTNGNLFAVVLREIGRS